MQIVCPNCATAYRVEPGTVGPTGRSVRCARCRAVWFAANSAALADVAEAHRADMTQFVASAPASAAAAESPQPDGGREPSGLEADLEVRVGGNQLPAAAATPIAVTVTDAPPIAPIEPAAAALEIEPREDIETVASRRFPARSQRRRTIVLRFGINWVSAALAAILVGLIGFRTEVVRTVPQTASLFAAIGLPVNVRGLSFANVKIETQVQNDVHVLTIEGEIAGTTGHAMLVPRLRFALRNASGHEIYTWTAAPSRSVLARGETLAFQTRLASPPTETQDVLVRFVSNGDRTGGID
jgi:predicted Zn finger-like uncharacterized protein